MAAVLTKQARDRRSGFLGPPKQIALPNELTRVGVSLNPPAAAAAVAELDSLAGADAEAAAVRARRSACAP